MFKTSGTKTGYFKPLLALGSMWRERVRDTDRPQAPLPPFGNSYFVQLLRT